jgi:hypothetical protein
MRMSGKPFVNVTEATAAEICIRFNVKKEALALLRDGTKPEEFADALVVNKHYVTGIEFMAFAMPPREAVWWGCLCVQHVYGEAIPPVEKEAVRAAVQWVVQPTEWNRVAVQGPAQMAGQATVGGGLAMAAYQTGNIAPPNMPPMAPRPFTSARSVAGAIKLACTKADPVKIVETQRLLLELGITVAEGNSG